MEFGLDKSVALALNREKMLKNKKSRCEITTMGF